MPTLNDELAAELALLNGALKPADVAQMLDVHVATVYRLINAKRLRTVSVGSGTKRRTGLKIPQASVLSYLRESAA